MDPHARRGAPALLFFAAILFVGPPPAGAHGDGRGGPVVKAAEEALESGEVSRAPIWVGSQAEPESRAALARSRTAAVGDHVLGAPDVEGIHRAAAGRGPHADETAHAAPSHG